MHRRYVSIWFPYLLTDWHVRKGPQLRGVAFALKAAVQNRVVITAASQQAVAAGVRTGMTVADAKALYPQLHLIDDKPGLGAQLLERIAEWCIRFTPVAAPDGPAGVLLDATGCAHLWGGEAAYLADIQRKLSSRSYTVRAAMAPTVGAAWAVARYGRKSFIVPEGGVRDALWTLPVAALRIQEGDGARLQRLGLPRVRDIGQMPRTALRRRFGDDLLRRLRQALGEEEEPVTPLVPPEPWQERLPCLEPIATRGGIEIALERLLDALCARLEKEGKGLRAASFRGYRIDGNVQGIAISTSRPTHRKEHLFHLFSLKLATIEPALGIELFTLDATTVEDAPAEQETLWEVRGGLDDPQVAALIDRLAGKVGFDAVHRYLPDAHHWPERSYKPAGSLAESAAGEWKLDRPRPLQLLEPAERIEVTAPVPDYPPMGFRYRDGWHKVVRADGPERIEPEWWIREGPHRDYYCLEDEAGRRYWVYREGHYTPERTEKWFLHGRFA